MEDRGSDPMLRATASNDLGLADEAPVSIAKQAPEPARYVAPEVTAERPHDPGSASSAGPRRVADARSAAQEVAYWLRETRAWGSGGRTSVHFMWEGTQVRLEVEVNEAEVFIRFEADVPDDVRRSLLEGRDELSELLDEDGLSLAYLGEERSARDSREQKDEDDTDSKEAPPSREVKEGRETVARPRKGATVDLIG